MKHSIDLAERIRGTYWHAAAILKLDLDSIVKAPLEELRFEIGGGAITRRVRADVGPMTTERDSLRIPLHWRARDHPNLFPVMHGGLHIANVGGNHIELRLLGEYRSPLGAVGAVADVSRLVPRTAVPARTRATHAPRRPGRRCQPAAPSFLVAA